MNQFFGNVISSVKSALSSDNKEATKQVVEIQNNPTLTRLAQNYELAIQSISWEDNARFKNSCWGPVISDMSLCLSKGNSSDFTLLPMIRAPNFADKTADVAIEKFSITVGNERGLSNLSRISLKEYLTNAAKYLVKGDRGIDEINPKVKNLFIDKIDKHILTSAQFCILPLNQGKCEFNVCLFNYQSMKENPAVLVIVASSQGTSAQVIVDGKTCLYFNQNGQASNIEAVRLKDDRQAKGKALEGKMDLDEQERNVIFVYQVPLKQKQVVRRSVMQYETMCCMQEECNSIPQMEFQSATFTKKIKRGGANQKLKRGMDDAMLNAGATHSEFVGVGDYSLERNPEFPIRCTLQYYKVTDTANLPEQVFQEMREKIMKTYNSGVAMGSLVIDGQTHRTTDVVTQTLADVTPQQRKANPLFSFFSA